jgi:hypothetical protein
MQTNLGLSAAEVIALLLQELPTPRIYLYPQIFAGSAYIIASGFLAALWRNLRRRDSALSLRSPPDALGDVELQGNLQPTLAGAERNI